MTHSQIFTNLVGRGSAVAKTEAFQIPATRKKNCPYETKKVFFLCTTGNQHLEQAKSRF